MFKLKVLFYLFLLIVILGLAPWEPLFSIEIRNGILKILTDTSLGIAGLIGLITIGFFHARRKSNKLSFMLILIYSGLGIILMLCLLISAVIPTFKWQDVAVYQSGNDYLIVQEKESFVTSNIEPARLIHTTSPYSAIRKITFAQAADASLFTGKQVKYHGKLWQKQAP